MTGILRGTHLALDGGTPVRSPAYRWPRWPVLAPRAEEMVLAALRSTRWAISSPHDGELFERRFARAFADYVGTRHCVPTDHGSSALVIALEALGLAHGDRVLVPALTWVASASAVFRAGLVPVLVDVDPATGCVGPEALDVDCDARAVIAVHWASAMADVPALNEAAAARGMSVIEDAAQAHGAQWAGRSAGSLGRLGCFSMQHAKVLTCGEGGAVVTDDDELAPVLEELRADSRRYRGEPRPGLLDLDESATTLGSNFCLDEFGAALLCAQLEALDYQHETRNRNYERLARNLSEVPGAGLLRHRAEQNRLSLYEVPVVFDELPADRDNTWLAEALTAELGTRVSAPRTPLNTSPLLRPWTKPTLAPLTEAFRHHNGDRSFPGAEHLAANAVQFHHSAFLGDSGDMDQIAEAITKVLTAVRA